MLKDAEALGITDFFLKNTSNEKDYEIYPENKNAVLLFLLCQTQWRAGSLGVIGLDYGVAFKLMKLYKMSKKRQTFENFQIMESRAKELINQTMQNSKEVK